MRQGLLKRIKNLSTMRQETHSKTKKPQPITYKLQIEQIIRKIAEETQNSLLSDVVICLVEKYEETIDHFTYEVTYK